MPTLNSLIALGGGYTPPQFDYQSARGNALRNALLEQQVQSYPQDQAWQQEQRQAVRQKMQWLTEDRVKELENQPIKDAQEQMKFFLTIGPAVNFQNYGASRKWLVQKNGLPEFLFPEPDAFVQKSKETGEPPEQLFERWKGTVLTNTDQKLREKLGMAKLESAEQIAGLKIDSADRLAQSRLDAYKDRQDLFFKHAKDVEDLRAQHRKELDEAKATGREGRDLLSRQKESRLAISAIFGANQFNKIDEASAERMGMAYEEASKMLSDNPEMDPQTAANRSVRSVNMKFKSLDSIPRLQKPGFMSAGNRDQTRAAVRSALDNGVDTKSILQKMISAGWSQADAVQEIRNAAIQ
jgi:hypothetical protein